MEKKVTRGELAKIVEDLIADEAVIFQQKGEEYTIGKAETEDALFNFRQVAELTGLKMSQVAAVYWLKHVFSILNFIKQGKVFSDEPIRGRINDARNYLAFIYAILEEEQAKGMNAEQFVEDMKTAVMTRAESEQIIDEHYHP